MSQLSLLSELKRTDVTSSLHLASVDQLSAYAAALCHPMAYGEFGERQFLQVTETVRVQLLRAQVGALQEHVIKLQGHVVELHNHITTLNTGNTKIQKWVIALAVAALVSTLVQTVVTVLAYVNTPTVEPASKPTAPPLPALPTQLAPPIPAAVPSSGQPIKKVP